MTLSLLVVSGIDQLSGIHKIIMGKNEKLNSVNIPLPGYVPTNVYLHGGHFLTFSYQSCTSLKILLLLSLHSYLSSLLSDACGFLWVS